MNKTSTTTYEHLRAVEQLYRRCARRYLRDADKAAKTSASLRRQSDVDYYAGIAEGLRRAAVAASHHANQISNRIHRDIMERGK